MAALEVCLEDHRQLYNAALEERREAWKTRAASVNYYHQATQLPEIRKADPGGQGRWSAGSQQQTLRRLDKAFAAFFRRVKAGEKTGYPRFRGRGWFDTVDWPAQKRRALELCAAPDCDPRLPPWHRQCRGSPAQGRPGHREDGQRQAGRQPLVRHPGLR